jgi:hypothetical protein
MVGTFITAVGTPFLLVHIHLPAWSLTSIAVVIVSSGIGADMIAESVLLQRRSSSENQIS